MGMRRIGILLEGGGMTVGEVGGRIVRVPSRGTWEEYRAVPDDLLALARDLA
jgi:hypothetical protein